MSRLWILPSSLAFGREPDEGRDSSHIGLPLARDYVLRKQTPLFPSLPQSDKQHTQDPALFPF